MNSYRKELWFNLPARVGFVNITPQVEEALQESEIQDGICLVNIYPTTLLTCLSSQRLCRQP